MSASLLATRDSSKGERTEREMKIGLQCTCKLTVSEQYLFELFGASFYNL